VTIHLLMVLLVRFVKPLDSVIGHRFHFLALFSAVAPVGRPLAPPDGRVQVLHHRFELILFLFVLRVQLTDDLHLNPDLRRSPVVQRVIAVHVVQKVGLAVEGRLATGPRAHAVRVEWVTFGCGGGRGRRGWRAPLMRFVMRVGWRVLLLLLLSLLMSFTAAVAVG
jgi:hypothetical protein